MIEDPNFSLDLGPDWRALPEPQAPQTYGFMDEARDLVILLSAQSQNVSPNDLEQCAQLLVDLELHKETLAAQMLGYPSTIYEPVIAPQPWGQAIAYYGYDASGRQFSYSGMITCRCKISLYLWTHSLREQELLEVMDDVSSRIVFDRTPLGQSFLH